MRRISLSMGMPDEWLDQAISRRCLLRWVGGGVTAAAMVSLLAACGGDDDDDEPESEATAPDSTTPGPAGESTATTGVADATATTGDATESTEPAETPTTGAGAQPATEGGQVSVIWRTPVSMSPLFSTAGSEQQVERLIFGALVKMKDRKSVV